MSDARCPLCDGLTAEAFSVGDRNRGIGDGRFTYRRCLRCRVLYEVDPPDDLGPYYPDDYHQPPDPAELDRHAAAEEPKLALLRPFAASGRLIDIGSGYGSFARAARNAGYEVTAIELDARCCEYLERVVGVRAICSDTPERELAHLGSTRVVTLWHVLEHLPRPWDVLAAAAKQLEAGGALVVATPNPDSLQFRLLRARWAHVDAPRHLFLIPFAALRDRVRALGLEVGHVTTADSAGRHWNRFGWEYALRGCPARRPAKRGTFALSLLVSALLAPIEHRDLKGAAYTAVFVKH
ncbi:MAG: class I SAM-dependent methyltransferase [Gaiellaceae bacterium]